MVPPGTVQCPGPAAVFTVPSRDCLSEPGHRDIASDRHSRQWEPFVPSLKAREGAVTSEEVRRAGLERSEQGKAGARGAEQIGGEVMRGPELGQGAPPGPATGLGTGDSAGRPFSSLRSVTRCCQAQSGRPRHHLATALPRCAPRPCCSSSACTRRSSCGNTWRSSPSTTCSFWSTPTRRQCCLELTRTQVWCRVVRCTLGTCCGLGSGRTLGAELDESRASPAQPAGEACSQTVATRTS